MFLGFNEVKADPLYQSDFRGLGNYHIDEAQEEGTTFPWPSTISHTSDTYMVKGYMMAHWTLYPTKPGDWLLERMARFSRVYEEGDRDVVEWTDCDLYESMECGALCLLSDTRRSPGWYRPFALNEHISPQLVCTMLDTALRCVEQYHQDETGEPLQRGTVSTETICGSPAVILYWMDDVLDGTMQSRATFAFPKEGEDVVMTFKGIKRASHAGCALEMSPTHTTIPGNGALSRHVVIDW